MANPTDQQLDGQADSGRGRGLLRAGGHPDLFFLRERSVKVALPPGENYVSVGFRQLKTTFSHIRQYRDLFRLLIAFLIYNDGIVTVIYFAGLYAKNTLQFTPSISA